MTGGKERNRLTGENAEMKDSFSDGELRGNGLKSVDVVDVVECIGEFEFSYPLSCCLQSSNLSSETSSVLKSSRSSHTPPCRDSMLNIAFDLIKKSETPLLVFISMSSVKIN